MARGGWRWSALREQVFRRDSYRCAECGVQHVEFKGQLQADHIIPLAEGGAAFDINNLRTLCTSCHIGITSAYKLRKQQRNKDIAPDTMSIIEILEGSGEGSAHENRDWVVE